MRAPMANPKRSPKIAAVPVLPVRDTVHFPGLINTLHVVREPSQRAIRQAYDTHQVVVLSQRDNSLESPSAADLYTLGSISEVLQSIPLPDTSLRVALRGLRRVHAVNVFEKDGCFWAEIEDVMEPMSEGFEVDAMMRACVEAFTDIVELGKDIPPEALQGIAQIEDPSLLTDSISHHLPIKHSEKQALLEQLDPRKRLDEVLHLLKREQQILELRSRIHLKVEKELGDTQREYYLREQLRIIQHELHEREDRLGETDEYREKIIAAQMPEEALEKATAELRRLDRAPGSSPEGMVSRNYLDLLVALPWAITTEDRLDVNAAKQLLDLRHFGLEKVKDRILDFLAVRQLKHSLRGPILCLVGPPGVGKTSIARSIAEATGRKYVGLSLGGVRDESEIRGHRRTYIGSMPGRIIEGIRNCGSRNPVIALDEIDKLGQSGHGDPMSALLEALDPEQNHRFVDHYLDTAFDLSATMFVATANYVENIPVPLRDRMEIISFPAYTEEERIAIAKQFLWPHEVLEHGLQPNQVTIEEEALRALVKDYTREAGVRNLDQKIAAVCRKVARRIAEGAADQVRVDSATVETFLGHPRFRRAAPEKHGAVGVAWGLVVGEAGGGVVPIEVALVSPLGDRPELKLTGNLGDVMKESALAALTFLQSSHRELGSEEPFRYDVHIHVPEGAVPKEGPSAGITLAVALASAFSGRAVRSGVAMTGEVTLRGRVLPVGGVRDKVLAAAAAGFTEVILPEENLADLDEVPAGVRSSLHIYAVSGAKEALDLALEPTA